MLDSPSRPAAPPSPARRFPVMLIWCGALLAATTAGAQEPALREADRVRIAEAFRLTAAVGDCIWSGWSAGRFPLLLVTPEWEFLIDHPSPSRDFARVGYDSLLASDVYTRPRQHPPNFLATFPAVAGIPTVVVGQPENTGKSSTLWVITALHEHFHQLQYSWPGYRESVEALDLAGGDESGMWMLSYPFPYDSAAVAERFSEYRAALERALEAARGREADQRLREFLGARARLRDTVGEKNHRYLSFQLWQEGVARYTEYRVADAAAELHEPLAAFQALADFVPYAAAADSLRNALAQEMAKLDLASWRRVVFYPIGATEALLLDALRPGWRRRYFAQPFYLERYFERR